MTTLDVADLCVGDVVQVASNDTPYNAATITAIEGRTLTLLRPYVLGTEVFSELVTLSFSDLETIAVA